MIYICILWVISCSVLARPTLQTREAVFSIINLGAEKEGSDKCIEAAPPTYTVYGPDHTEG